MMVYVETLICKINHDQGVINIHFVLENKGKPATRNKQRATRKHMADSFLIRKFIIHFLGKRFPLIDCKMWLSLVSQSARHR